MMKKKPSRYFIIVFLLFLVESTRTKEIFDGNFLTDHHYSIDDCVPFAFGDFNADKIIDIFCRTTDGQTIRVMLNNDRSTRVVEQCRTKIPTGQIFDLIAADFDSDSRLDLFVLYKISTNQNDFYGGFFWGNRTDLSEFQPLNISFQSSPTVLE